MLACVARAKFTISEGGYNKTDRIHGLNLNHNEPVRLKGSQLLLKMQMAYEIIPVNEPGKEPWRVTTHAYNYEVQAQNGQVIFSYHWHPQGKVKEPHIHMGHTQLAVDAVLTNKFHLPTARVSFEGVMRHCITELGTEPLREDWAKVLERREADFQAHRKWDTKPPVEDPEPEPAGKKPKKGRKGKRR